MTFDLLTSKSIGHILDSWWVSVWSFMIIGWLQSQLSSGNHFQITMRHDLDLWPFDPKINRAHPWLMGSKCMKFHDHRWITESVIVRKLVWRTDRLTDRLTDRQTECKPIVPSGFTGGGLITMRHDLDLWPFDLKINRAHPWLMVSKCMKFQPCAMTLTFDLKINRAHPWLMVSKCMKFHDHRLITESVIVRKPFSNNHAPWPWPLTFWPQNQ